MLPNQITTALTQAKQAAQAGDKPAARALVSQLIKSDPRNEDAWLLFSEVAEKKEHSIYCLEQVLKLNPANMDAVERLNAIKAPPPAPQTPPARVVSEPDATKTCPYCAETIKASATVCRFCNRNLSTGTVITATRTPQSAPVAEVKTKRKKWYMATWMKILTFLFLTPLWTLIVLDDPDSTTGVKVVATILLVIYILGACSLCYSLSLPRTY